jgi:hypothetical protein
MRRGEPRKRKDGKRQEQGKAKQDDGVNPKKKSPASESGRYTSQEPTHKDSVWGPGEKKIGSRTDLKDGNYKDASEECARAREGPGNLIARRTSVCYAARESSPVEGVSNGIL